MNGPSRMSVRLVFISGAICLSVGAPALHATALPDSYPLNRAAAGPTPVDSALDAWLAEHGLKSSPMELPDDKFAEFVAKQDQVTAAFLKLARLNAPEVEDADDDEPAEFVGPPKSAAMSAKPKETRRSIIDAALTQLKSDFASGQLSTQNHPLLPILYLNMLKSPELEPNARADVAQRFGKTAAGTCASKQSLLTEVTKENLSRLSDDDLKVLLVRVDHYRSRSFKQVVVRRIVANISEQRHKAIGEQLLAMAQLYPALIKSSPWLSKLAEQTGKAVDSHEPELSFNKARQFAGKKLCAKAKDLMLEGLRLTKGLGSLTDATNTGKLIDGCFSARDTQLRSEFWRNITKAMNDTYGFDGWAEARLRLGLIDWSNNKFDL